jgi:hypothetical protein
VQLVTTAVCEIAALVSLPDLTNLGTHQTLLQDGTVQLRRKPFWFFFSRMKPLQRGAAQGLTSTSLPGRRCARGQSSLAQEKHLRGDSSAVKPHVYQALNGCRVT